MRERECVKMWVDPVPGGWTGKKFILNVKTREKSPFFVILNSENRIFYLTDFRIFKSVLENPVI